MIFFFCQIERVKYKINMMLATIPKFHETECILVIATCFVGA